MSTLLPPAAHNALIARWAWFAYRENEVSIDADRMPGQDHAWKAAHDAAVTHIETAIKGEAKRLDGTTSEPPSAYAGTLLSYVDRVVGDGLSDQKEKVLQGFRNYLTRLTADDRDPLSEMCEAVMAATVCLYRKHAVKVPKDFVESLTIRIDHDVRHTPGSFWSPFRGEAVVVQRCLADNCCRDTKDHFQTLQITLIPPEFDRASLSALPFVLFHECVSHVMQGPWTSDRQRPDEASLFAEGWMDLAAQQVFEHALNQRRWPCIRHQLVPYPHAQDFFKSGGKQMCDARHPQSDDFIDLGAESRRQGWNAATDTLEAMQKNRISNAASAFLRPSFQLNASDIPPVRRDTIVTTLGGALRPRLSKTKESQAIQIIGALRAFAAGGQLEQLLEIIDAITPSRLGNEKVTNVYPFEPKVKRLPFAK